METGSATELRSGTWFLHLKKNSEIHQQLVEVYGSIVRSRKQVWFWSTEFDKGRTDVRDEGRTFSTGPPFIHSRPHTRPLRKDSRDQHFSQNRCWG
ncbi:hypothetical protein TNCV_2837901 [Trichonephila clavipes]|nr:hypothetical protein TNCV_2837901 [Trichonephila clavipes]